MTPTVSFPEQSAAAGGQLQPPWATAYDPFKPPIAVHGGAAYGLKEAWHSRIDLLLPRQARRSRGPPPPRVRCLDATDPASSPF